MSYNWNWNQFTPGFVPQTNNFGFNPWVNGGQYGYNTPFTGGYGNGFGGNGIGVNGFGQNSFVGFNGGYPQQGFGQTNGWNTFGTLVEFFSTIATIWNSINGFGGYTNGWNGNFGYQNSFNGSYGTPYGYQSTFGGYPVSNVGQWNGTPWVNGRYNTTTTNGQFGNPGWNTTQTTPEFAGMGFGTRNI